MRSLMFFMLFSLFPLVYGQHCVDLTTEKGRSVKDSLDLVYTDFDVDSNLRKIHLDSPGAYQWDFMDHYMNLHREYQQTKELNFDWVHIDYYVAENGRILYWIYELRIIEGKKLQPADHDFIRKILHTYPTVNIRSTIKFRHNANLAMMPR